MKEIVRIKFGSHLYGTATTKSDLDYKGVFLPNKEDLLLNRIPKIINKSTNKTSKKNTSDDIDMELYSLHYFIKLASKGETVALDMVHAPNEMIVKGPHPVWELIANNKEKFYTRNLKAFVGYARRQAAKYGIKGSRLNAAADFLEVCKNHSGEKMSSIWGYLVEDEHRHFIEPSPNGIRQYQVCGKILQETMLKSYAAEIIFNFYQQYGHRAKLAAQNEGIDWKAVSHAIRAACQVKEVLTKNTITFPRPEADLLLKVKKGELDYTTEVAPILESLMEEVEMLSENSTLPSEPDNEFWNSVIIFSMEDYVL